MLASRIDEERSGTEKGPRRLLGAALMSV